MIRTAVSAVALAAALVLAGCQQRNIWTRARVSAAWV